MPPVNYGLDEMPAAYLAAPDGYPAALRHRPVDRRHARRRGARAPPAGAGAIELGMQEETAEPASAPSSGRPAGGPFDAARIQPNGYGAYANVITSVEFERLVDPAHGSHWRAAAPRTASRRRTSPSSSAPARATRTTCATARASAAWRRLKQTQYVREAGRRRSRHGHYIDIRAIDRFEDFYQRCRRTRRSASSSRRSRASPENSENGNPSCTASTPRATATPPSTTWWCWLSAWSRRSGREAKRTCPPTSSRSRDGGFIEAPAPRRPVDRRDCRRRIEPRDPGS